MKTPWISLKEKAPPFNVGILVCDHGIITVAVAEPSNCGDGVPIWRSYGIGHGVEWELAKKYITHWMPLPELPANPAGELVCAMQTQAGFYDAPIDWDDPCGPCFEKHEGGDFKTSLNAAVDADFLGFVSGVYLMSVPVFYRYYSTDESDGYNSLGAKPMDASFSKCRIVHATHVRYKRKKQ